MWESRGQEENMNLKTPRSGVVHEAVLKPESGTVVRSRTHGHPGKMTIDDWEHALI